MMEDIALSMGLEPRISQKIIDWRDALHETDVVHQIIDQNRTAIAAWIATKLS